MMQLVRFWSLLGSAATGISGVHPLLYLTVYLLLVPIFAAIYCQLPGSYNCWIWRYCANIERC